MSVRYYRDILKDLIDAGCTQADIARALDRTRANINTMLGNNKGQEPPEDLSAGEMRIIVKLCKKHKVDVNWSKIGKMIDLELNKNKSKS